MALSSPPPTPPTPPPGAPTPGAGPAAGPPPAPAWQPLCRRNLFLSGLLSLFVFFASAFAGLVAVRLVVPGAQVAYLLGGFMLPLGWALGWLGVRHLVMACVMVLAPFLLPVLLLVLLLRYLRGKAVQGDAPPPRWRPDYTLLLIIPGCALTATLTGLVGAFEAELPYLRSAGLMAGFGAAWGLMLALLQVTGLLPDEDDDPSAP